MTTEKSWARNNFERDTLIDSKYNITIYEVQNSDIRAPPNKASWMWPLGLITMCISYNPRQNIWDTC